MEILNKHYIRIDTNNYVIYSFSDAFEQPLETDILIEEGERHYNLDLRKDDGSYNYKYVDGEIIQNTDVDFIRLKAAKIVEIKQQCKDKIESGFYSEVKYGSPKLYTLKDYEQTNMIALIMNITGGATSVPWRNSEMIVCDQFLAADFTLLYQQASVFTINLRYKSDFIELWISETTMTIEEILSISMDSALPQNYQDMFVAKLTENGIPLWA
jgi:hypothetical protein